MEITILVQFLIKILKPSTTRYLEVSTTLGGGESF